MKNSISQQDVFQIFLNGHEYRFKINSKINWTMVDGKVINFATDNSATLRCNICRQTYKDFKNDRPETKYKINEKLMDFGISPLHTKLKFLIIY